MEADQIRDAVKTYILEEFLPGERSSAIDDETPLITGGILESIATIKLVTFLETRYDIQFEAHEMSADYLDSISAIANTVRDKLAG